MNTLTKVVGLLGLAVLLSFVLSLPVMLLWNGCLVPAINGINEVTWLQAWGISILSSLLIRGTSVEGKV